MSVINKMLRDLDQRRATALDPALRAGVAMAPGRSGVPGPASRSAWRGAHGAGALLLLAVLVGAAWYWSAQTAQGLPPAQPVVEVPQVAVAIASPAAPAPLPTASVPAAPAWATPAPAPVLATQPGPVEAAVVPASAAPKAPVRVSGAQALEAPGLRFSPSLLMKPHAASTAPANSAGVAAPAAPAAIGPDPAVAAQRQQTATRDVLAQAQSLYSTGSADAAIQLLQESLQTAERASPPAPAATQLALVRELARMELALGRAAAVLELLARVEPLLSGQADLWAVRANAAQRLGRHPEAVQFYATALQTRPSEPRWLLGSAVSQAALGQLASAAELAEKARAIGPVSKEVWAYLRQQGVSLSDRP